MDINYNVSLEELFKQLGNSKVMVLATSHDNRVTARNMSCVIYNHKIYFQTEDIFVKVDQIRNNPRVALCVDNIQIEGIARIKGHPAQDAEFIETFKKYFKGSYDKFTLLRRQIYVEIEPTFITLWKYLDGNKPYRDFIDCVNQRAYRELYDISDKISAVS